MCISFTLWFILGVLDITFAHHLTFPIPQYIIITPLSFYLLGWSTLLETGSLACLFFFWGGRGEGYRVQKERNIENKINLQCWPKLRRLKNNNISLLLYYHVFIIIICISSDLGWGKCVFTKATHLYLVKNMCDPQNFTLPPTFCATWRLAED